ncbi:Rpn family recombination-promoting nuclease/putative transposase [Sphingobacterium olei]|uniref:Rpn family recombination-promoting nuclease/putative transposase n=1 Tax=Sphingobacterium olei TaxID=2571155 RepID=A0A4U0P019_9SPHI|nr:Rpn family recombination-promoting nuclease/putative transposase [Sphingobacterium olei]TJZ60516.1 Rpn family recombination-promoting nuclease/putative transposase [Sphingobacterium olei]
MIRYIDPLTDFSFKRLFGSEPNKDLLIDLLNGIFRGRKRIVDLIYNKNEHVGDGEAIGSVIFDLSCTGDDGSKFLIEVQRTEQIYLKRRMLYYSSKLISDQAPKGKRASWNYDISEVYVIVLMDGFPMPGGSDGRYLHDVCLCNRDSGEIFYEELGFFYVELVNFVKDESDLQTDLDKWLYVLKNMSRMDKIPLYLRKSIFEKLFQIAEYSKLNKEEREMYDVSLKRRWDEYSVRETARQKGYEEGIQQGIEKGIGTKNYEIVKKLIIQHDWSDESIVDFAEVSLEFVKKVRVDLAKGEK